MTMVSWTLLVTVAVTGCLVAALSAEVVRIRIGLSALCIAVAGLLLILGVDLLAAGWVLVFGPVIASLPAASSRLVPTPIATRVLGGVVAVGLFAAIYLLAVRVDWAALPSASFVAQTAEVGARLLTREAPLLLALVLAWAVLVARSPGGKDTA